MKRIAALTAALLLIATPAQGAVNDNKEYARNYMLTTYGWSEDQFACLESLWTRESGWKHTSRNKRSGAYGIPQALPASKMKSAGKDWKTNPQTQIRWGLNYIAKRYKSPCGAYQHAKRVGWY